MDWTWLENLLMPQLNTCHLCNRMLFSRETYICEDCFKHVYRSRIPALERKQRMNDEFRVFSAFWYEGEARELMVNLKYHHDTCLSVIVGYLLAEAFIETDIPSNEWVVVPVPVHPKRLKDRGYNQAQLIANMFCKTIGMKMEPELLKRVHFEGSQVRRNRSERLQAMKNAFQAVQSLEEKKIMLLDDVLTTGATLCSCADALKKAGAAEVKALTFCRA